MVCPITQGDHKEERRRKKQDENIMVCPITQGDHNKRQRQAYMSIKALKETQSTEEKSINE